MGGGPDGWRKGNSLMSAPTIQGVGCHSLALTLKVPWSMCSWRRRKVENCGLGAPSWDGSLLSHCSEAAAGPAQQKN